MPFKTKLIRYSLLSFLLLFMVILRVFLGSYFEYNKGLKFYLENDYEKSRIHLSRSIRFYLPLSPIVKKSIEKMREIVKVYDSKKDFTKSLRVLETLRSSIYSTRSFYVPYKDIINECDQRIADIRSVKMGSQTGSKDFSRADILKTLKEDKAPSSLFSILAIFGFLGWVFSVLYYILVIMNDTVFKKKKAAVVGVLFFIFYFIWIIGLFRA